MQKILLLAGCTFLFFGCSKVPAPAETPQNSPLSESPQKTGDTIKMGTIIKIGTKYYIQEPGKQPSEVESYTINFSSYANKNVTIAGQYSGDTLFVGKIDLR